MVYLLKTPTATWFCGESVRAVTIAYNASLPDKRMHVQRSNLYSLLRGEIKSNLHKLCELQKFDSVTNIPSLPTGVKILFV